MTPERELLVILREKVAVCYDMYVRARDESRGTESLDTIDKLRLQWLDAEEAVAREIIRREKP